MKLCKNVLQVFFLNNSLGFENLIEHFSVHHQKKLKRCETWLPLKLTCRGCRKYAEEDGLVWRDQKKKKAFFSREMEDG